MHITTYRLIHICSRVDLLCKSMSLSTHLSTSKIVEKTYARNQFSQFFIVKTKITLLLLIY